MERPLRRLASTTGPLPASLNRLNRSTAVLEELPGYFKNLQRILLRVEPHVATSTRTPDPPSVTKCDLNTTIRSLRTSRDGSQ